MSDLEKLKRRKAVFASQNGFVNANDFRAFKYRKEDIMRMFQMQHSLANQIIVDAARIKEKSTGMLRIQRWRLEG